ncbi:MAPEG family protein [Novosphingobium sp. 1949]|uniref:MAPEG family protein n=1 Tax=Novosphingobium organovorum TaxID=2930092 RepID=A0ABT0B7X9_9SPHN|nr:MAPEG family protein [Novosphingobium organovorum]MCJ2181175.1 MAPEG family protein [Novosphingobium organovorum]
MILQTTLSLSAAAVAINLWLGTRIAAVRNKDKIWHGDGDNPLLMRRMRAQANFIENTPFLLILAAAIELSGAGGTWLWVAGGAYMLARIAHALGMDAATPNPARGLGFGAGLLVSLGLAAVAVLVAVGRF